MVSPFISVSNEFLCENRVLNYLKWKYNRLRKREKLKKIVKTNYDCVVLLGNGPSLQDCDFDGIISRLQDPYFAVVNYFAVQNQDLFQKIKPHYYYLFDPDIFSDVAEKEKVLKSLLSIDWPMTLVVPACANIHIENSFITIEFVSECFILPFRERTFKLYENNKASMGRQNVIVGALEHLISSGTRNIFMHGVDQDWHRELYVNEDNEVLREYKHFYGTELINVTKAGQIKKGNLYRYFYWYYLTLLQFARVRQYADYKKCRIVNMSPSSYIDVFDKIKCDDIHRDAD